MEIEGVDADGYLCREGSLERIQPDFTPLVERLRMSITRMFDADRLHSAYLYGSVPRGTAVVGRSDLDVLLALRREPTARDRSDVDFLAEEIDADFREIRCAGIETASAATLLSEPERYRWYLLAYDLDRDDWRNFRVDRMTCVAARTWHFHPRGARGGTVRPGGCGEPGLPAPGTVPRARTRRDRPRSDSTAGRHRPAARPRPLRNTQRRRQSRLRARAAQARLLA
jgi:predicted nucleotidyltransferase